MTELEFVRRIGRRFPFSRGIGIGDDASVVPMPGGFQLITTDLLVENVHFRLADFRLPDLARKALAVNISDIAAMGGTPQYAYLGLAYPDRLPSFGLQAFFKGIADGCRKWKMELAGGDFSASSLLLISLTVVGHCRRPVLRRGARPGDWIGITGPVGESALGLELLQRGRRGGRFVRRHMEVDPQVAAGQLLAPYVTSMIDISDGLLLDLQRILDASGVGAEIETARLPIAPETIRQCRKIGLDPVELALAGGEDYQLLFTVPAENERVLRRRGFGGHLIGRIRKGRRLMVRGPDGERIPTSKGYDHFSKERRTVNHEIQ